MCWHNKVEEFSTTLDYAEGPHNIPADNLSRLHCLVTPGQVTEEKILVEPTVVSDDEDDTYFLTQEFSGFHDDKMVELIDKLPGQGYGLLPEREVCIATWEEVIIG